MFSNEIFTLPLPAATYMLQSNCRVSEPLQMMACFRSQRKADSIEPVPVANGHGSLFLETIYQKEVDTVF